MAKFYYSRTKRIVDIPDDRADEYEKRRWYTRLPDDFIGEHEPAAVFGVAVPSGTVAEVLAWAGDDRILRAAALEVEKAGKNRKGIIDALG